MKRQIPLVLALVAGMLSSSCLLPGQTPCQPWSPLGTGVTHRVNDLAVFDDGTGPALFAGGVFQSAGGATAGRIAKWDGSTWSPLGSGTNHVVYALEVFDDGMGPDLYAAGFFTTAGGVSTSKIARWDGSTWSPLGSGTSGFVYTLGIFDDGTGPGLYAAGDFQTAGGASASRIARWDGSTWSPLGSGTNSRVEALAVFDDGTGPALYVGGNFAMAGGQFTNYIARWDGMAWSALGAGTDGVVNALAVFDDGTGPALYAAGDFGNAGGAPASNVARWDGSSWSAAGSGVTGTVYTLSVLDEGAGPALYAAGSIYQVAGRSVDKVARWDGSTWSGLGSGPSSTVYSLAGFDDGTGPGLYVGGQYSQAGSVSAANIARYKSTASSLLWQPNSPVARLDFDGVLSSCSGTGAVSTHYTAQGATVNISSTQPAGTPFDLLVNLAPIIPADHLDAVVTAGGQNVNIHFIHPGTLFLSSGSILPTFMAYPGDQAIPYTLPVEATLSAQMVVLDATHSDGFVLSQACQAEFSFCPLLEDFETATPGNPGVHPAGWVDGGGTWQWRVNSGTTATMFTGPSGNHTPGGSNYIYCEASSPAVAGDTYIIELPQYDTASLTNPYCEFAYHMYGADMGLLQLQEFDGVNWNMVWHLWGGQGDTWHQMTIPITGGSATRLRFHYMRAFNLYGDIAIDDVRICH